MHSALVHVSQSHYVYYYADKISECIALGAYCHWWSI